VWTRWEEPTLQISPYKPAICGSGAKDPTFCRTSPWNHKHGSRLGITPSGVISRVDAPQRSIQCDPAGTRPCPGATRLNHQLPECISWRPDPFAQGTNALQLNFKELDGYAFPPFCLIGRCIQKIRQEQNAIIIVVPLWPSQAWYPSLMECLVDLPLCLPKRMDQAHPMIRQQISMKRAYSTAPLTWLSLQFPWPTRILKQSH